MYFVRFGAVVVLLCAVLPNVLYVGHWSLPGLPAEAIETAGEAHDHAAHCHGDRSECSGSAFGQALPIEAPSALVLLAGGLLLLPLVAFVLASKPVSTRLTPPPRLIPYY